MIKKPVVILGIILCSIIAIPLFLLLATSLSNFILQVIDFYNKEWVISKADFTEFHPGYFWFKLILIAAGFIAIISVIAKAVLSRVNKKVSFSFLGFAVLVVFTAAVLSIYEHDFRDRGFRPGVLGWGFDFKDTLIEHQYYYADERGMNYLGKPWRWLESIGINSQGFVSSFEYDAATIERMRAEGKKIVFIIGDSFVEGTTEDLRTPGQYDSTFVEMLRAAHPEYAVCAFGVGGTDPVHYSLIAEKFIPQLEPDLVMLVMCWNDILEYDAPVTPFVPAFWQTNCGWLKSVVPHELTRGEEVILRSSREAYDYYTNGFSLWKRDDLAARFFRKSSVLTIAYIKLKDLSLPPVEKDSSTAYPYVKKVHDLSQGAGSKFVIAFIPDLHRLDTINSLEMYHKTYGMAFQDLLPVVHFPVRKINYNDYIGERNQHFNNSGNRKYFVILDSIITAQIQTPD